MRQFFQWPVREAFLWLCVLHRAGQLGSARCHDLLHRTRKHIKVHSPLVIAQLVQIVHCSCSPNLATWMGVTLAVFIVNMLFGAYLYRRVSKYVACSVCVLVVCISFDRALHCS